MMFLKLMMKTTTLESKAKEKVKTGKKRKPDKIRVDLSQDLKSLCRSLAAVKEDPSLLSGINDEDVIMPKKKPTGSRKRGRPPKKLSNDNDDPLGISPKLKIKKKKKKKKFKIKKLKIKPIPLPDSEPELK